MKIINIFKLGKLQNNTYLIKNKNKYILIDPSFRIEKVRKYLKENDIEIKEIWLTHTHYDHFYGMEDITRDFPNVKIYVPQKEQDFLKDKKENLSEGSRFEVTYTGETYVFTEKKAREEEMKIGYISGHSLESAIFIFEKDKIIISGDTLFKDTIGRVDLRYGNLENLKKGIQREIYKYNEDFLILPGHGDKTFLLYEKENNEKMKEI